MLGNCMNFFSKSIHSVVDADLIRCFEALVWGCRTVSCFPFQKLPSRLALVSSSHCCEAVGKHQVVHFGVSEWHGRPCFPESGLANRICAVRGLTAISTI